MWSHRLAIPTSVLALGVLSAQAPPGYHLGAAVTVPDSLVEVLADGRFRATVARSARTTRERALIATAERLYPDAATLLGSARDSAYRERLVGTASGTPERPYKVAPRAAGNPADRWWVDQFDATWLPFAVTGAAVDYYLNRLRDIAAGRGPFEYSPGQQPDNGTFEYRATLRRGTEPGVAYVVEMRISWDYWCGMLCAMSFTHTRSVSFDANGRVLRIAGDGHPSVGVS
jgi:hypothetical protein